MNTLKKLALPRSSAGAALAWTALAGAALAGAALGVTPANAQNSAVGIAETEAEAFADLDMMADVAAEEEPGILFAQEQASRGDFLQAIATLERVLALHPKSQSARLLHAVYLCQIDDQAGGAVELGKLKQKNFPDELWAQAMTLCPLAAEENK